MGLASIICLILFIRTMTVGSGISPDLLTPNRPKTGSGARGLPESHRDTAGGEFHPAPRISADSLKKKAQDASPKPIKDQGAQAANRPTHLPLRCTARCPF